MVSSDSHLVCPAWCWMPRSWSAAALVAHLAVAEPGHALVAMRFQDADERRQVWHFQPFGNWMMLWPPRASGRASFTALFVLAALVLAAAASLSRRRRDCAGQAVESRSPCVFAIADAMPIHLATTATSFASRATAINTCLGGRASRASACAWWSTMLFPLRSWAEMRSGTSASAPSLGQAAVAGRRRLADHAA